VNKKEIAHYKAAAFDLVVNVQKLRQQRLEIDGTIAALFRRGRSNGIDRKAIKETLAELRGDATAENVWSLYSKKIGLADVVAADDNPLDAILDGV
jgi:uncharacterized protein (UPF0335 family)